jgi:serine/threonine-protein kinase
MSERPDPGDVAAFRAEFVRRWEAALAGTPAPRLDDFLAGVPEPQRSALRDALEPIDREYRQRSAPTRGPAASKVPTVGPSGETIDRAPEPPGEVGDGVPDTFTADLPPPAERAADTPAPSRVDTSPAHKDQAVDSASAPLTPPPPSGVARGRGSSTPRPVAVIRGEEVGWPAVAGYEVLEVLGRGGMGVVYKARDVALDRLVALKMILAGAHAAPQHLARFRTEAQAVARLHHPNIVQIYEVGQQDGLPYVALEFVDGGSLAQKLAHDPQPIRWTAQTVEALARAVHSAHERGVVHRDLKPGNVLLAADGTPKITDFGLAKRLEAASDQTQSGEIMGTPQYMSPEQAAGDNKAVGPLSDVYSLGVILYKALTGRPPFVGETLMDTLEQVRTVEPLPPARLQLKVPRDLDTICLKCLQKEPARRYASARELADDLKRFLDGEPIRARPVSAPERLWRWCRRNPVVAALSAAVAALVLTAASTLVLYSVNVTHERNEKEKERQAAVEAEQKERAARELSEKRNDLALDAIRRFVIEAQDYLKNRPGLEELRKSLLRVVLDDLAGVARTVATTAVIDRRTAGAHQRIGDIYREAGEAQKALEEYRRSHAIVEALARDDPDSALTKRNLAASHNNFGDAYRLLDDTAKARDEYLRALELRKAWLAIEPDNAEARRQLANSYMLVGGVSLLRGRPADARDSYREAKKHWDQLPAELFNQDLEVWRERADLYDKLREVGMQLGDGATAVESLQGLISQYEDRLKEESRKAPGGRGALALQRDLVIRRIQLGDALLTLRDDARAARDEYQKARDSSEELLKANSPSGPIAQRTLSVASYRLGAACRRLGDRAAVDRAFQESLGLRKELAAKAAPDNQQVQTDLMLALAQCGQTREAAQIADGLRQRFSKDPRSLYNVACAYAICAGTAPRDDKPLAEGYAKSALDALREAVAHGWNNAFELRTNPEMDAIRGLPEFAVLLARLKPAGENPTAPKE